MNKIIPGMFLVALITSNAVHAKLEGSIHEFTLDNGLKLVVKEDHRAPVAIAQVWYKVGSADEQNGTTGISHVLEHMMFKGTERHPAGKFSALISENGGRENAFTSRDYTAYYVLLAADRLPISFELEADRMEGLTMAADEVVKEVEVVKEERRLRTEDNPNALAYEQLFAAAFDNSPYRNPVIGWMEDLNNLTREDLDEWYKGWYAPNNAVLVVVGDVDPAEIHRMAKARFGQVKRREVPAVKPRLEPPQRGPRRIIVKAPAELPYVVLGYKVPVYGQADKAWEPYALEVLSAILDGGRSSRLTNYLVRERELAASAGASYGIYGRFNGLLLMDGVPAVGRTIDEVEAALDAEIEKIRKQPVSEEELARIKAQVLAEEIYQQDSVSRQANLIGVTETLGLGWRVLDDYVENIQSVTAEQVREVAMKYLIEDRKTVAIVDPLPLAPQAAVRSDRREKGENDG